MASVFISEGTRRMAHQLDDLLERWKLKKSSNDQDENIIGRVSNVDEISPFKNISVHRIDSRMSAILAALTDGELTQLRVELDMNNNEIKAQIDIFNTQAKGYKDYEWKGQAKYVKRIYGVLIEATRAEQNKRGKGLGPGDIPQKKTKGPRPVALTDEERDTKRASVQAEKRAKYLASCGEMVDTDTEAISRLFIFASLCRKGDTSLEPPSWGIIDQVRDYLRANGYKNPDWDI